MIVPPPQSPAGLNSDCFGPSQAWAWFAFVHTSSCRSIFALQQSNNTEHVTWLTFLWFIWCGFGHRQPSHLAGTFDFARQHYTRWWLYFMSPFYAPMHERQHRAEAHLFQPYEGQGCVLCLSTVRSAHISQTNWTFETGSTFTLVKYLQPLVSAVLKFKHSLVWV